MDREPTQAEIEDFVRRNRLDIDEESDLEVREQGCNCWVKDFFRDIEHRLERLEQLEGKRWGNEKT